MAALDRHEAGPVLALLARFCVTTETGTPARQHFRRAGRLLIERNWLDAAASVNTAAVLLNKQISPPAGSSAAAGTMEE